MRSDPTTIETNESVRAEWRPRLLCLFGLTPFLAWHATTGSVIALIVVVNGILFHLFFPDSSLIKNYDVGVNACLALWVNASARDPIVTLLTLIGATSHAMNAVLARDDATHVMAVQMPLCAALCASGF